MIGRAIRCETSARAESGVRGEIEVVGTETEAQTVSPYAATAVMRVFELIL